MDLASSDLLKGVWYSLEQCGRLLKAAAVLYKEGDYSTAVGVAMFAREELGKHRILRAEWKKSVDTGKPPNVDEIRRACEDHVEKQKQGQMSVTLMTESPSALDTALRTRATSRPGDPGFKAADEVIQTAVETKAKHAPAERHEKRLEGFFVDLEQWGARWKRPSKRISQDEAKRLLDDTANDYAGQRDRFTNTALLEDSKLVAALEAWSDKPALPLPVWPVIVSNTTSQQPIQEAKKPCVACKCEIPAAASFCSVCKSYQRSWKNHLQYVAGVVTLIALTVSASFWLYERIHAAYFYHENVSVVACNTLWRTAVIVNRGDRDVFVSHLQLWMPGRARDWLAPNLEINQSLAPGRFFKGEFLPPKFDSGEFVRGLNSAEFEKLVSKAANNDPCLELAFFAGFDTHFIDLVQAAGGTLNTFDVGGYLEYWGARTDLPVRVVLSGKGVVRRSNAPACRWN
jgi:AbiV family abortive infection protein